MDGPDAQERKAKRFGGCMGSWGLVKDDGQGYGENRVGGRWQCHDYIRRTVAIMLDLDMTTGIFVTREPGHHVDGGWGPAREELDQRTGPPKIGQVDS
jgi:hypothetical protein